VSKQYYLQDTLSSVGKWVSSFIYGGGLDFQEAAKLRILHVLYWRVSNIGFWWKGFAQKMFSPYQK